MAFTSREIIYAVALTAILLAVILLAMAIYQYFLEPARKRKKINQRLNETGEYMRRIEILKERSKDQAGQRLIKKILGTKRVTELQTFMLQADVYKDPGSFWGQVLLIVIVIALVTWWITKNPLLALVAGGAAGLLPYFYLKWKKAGKTIKFESQMPDAMELLARSLRAGHTMPSAMELLGEEMGDPVGTEMKIAYEEQRFGISVPESLTHMVQRVDSMDLRYFVAAVLIQQETGGNLAELMENIARVIRDRLNFKAKVKALAASGRISAWIMIVTPIVTFFAIMVLAPQYGKILVTSSLGQKLLMVGVVLGIIGAYLLRRMIQALET
jgi:tight adherence protein B